MKTIIQDLGEEYNEKLQKKADMIIYASGKYAPCQGCFQCWTKTPATCKLKDSLQEMCRVLGQCDELTIITKNYYGGHSPAVKMMMDRSIGTSTPFSTYRGKQMHHTLRYGKKGKLTVVAYGDATQKELETWKLMVKRNAINDGYQTQEFIYLENIADLMAVAL